MSGVIGPPSSKQSATCDASPANRISILNDKDRVYVEITLKSLWMVDNASLIERLLIERRKPKKEVFPLANHESHRQCKEPIRLKVDTWSGQKARENVSKSRDDWFWFYFWLNDNKSQVIF